MATTIVHRGDLACGTGSAWRRHWRRHSSSWPASSAWAATGGYGPGGPGNAPPPGGFGAVIAARTVGKKGAHLVLAVPGGVAIISVAPKTFPTSVILKITSPDLGQITSSAAALGFPNARLLRNRCGCPAVERKARSIAVRRTHRRHAVRSVARSDRGAGRKPDRTDDNSSRRRRPSDCSTLDSPSPGMSTWRYSTPPRSLAAHIGRMDGWTEGRARRRGLECWHSPPPRRRTRRRCLRRCPCDGGTSTLTRARLLPPILG